MHYVNVNGEALEFLFTCPHLEELSISCSRELSTIKIIGPFPALKRLEISSCHSLKSVEIRDSNLVFLKYCGGRLQQLLLKNVPLLVEMFIWAVSSYCMKAFLLMISSYLPQLEILTIDREEAIFYSTVKMSNLKPFVLKFVGANNDTFGHNLMQLMILICVTSFLRRLVSEAYGDRVASEASEVLYVHIFASKIT